MITRGRANYVPEPTLGSVTHLTLTHLTLMRADEKIKVQKC